MKRNSLKLCWLQILVLFAWSCTKPVVAPPSFNKDLLAKTWKLTGATINGMDAFPDMASCLTDNLFIYATNGKYAQDEGATKCDPSDPQVVETATWSLQQNLLKYVYPDNTSEAYVISQLTPTTLKFTFTVNVGGTNFWYGSIYTAQ